MSKTMFKMDDVLCVAEDCGWWEDDFVYDRGDDLPACPDCGSPVIRMLPVPTIIGFTPYEVDGGSFTIRSKADEKVYLEHMGRMHPNKDGSPGEFVLESNSDWKQRRDVRKQMAADYRKMRGFDVKTATDNAVDGLNRDLRAGKMDENAHGTRVKAFREAAAKSA